MRLGWWLITSRLASGVNGFAPKSRFFTSLRALKHLSIGYLPELTPAMGEFRVGSTASQANGLLPVEGRSIGKFRSM
jgi:hypothetical protein